MPIDERTVELIREKLEKHEICLTEYGGRLMRIEEASKDLKSLAESVHEMAFNQRTMDGKIDTLTESVETLKEAPRKTWGTFKTALISAVGGAVGTGVIGIICHIFITMGGAK